MTLWTVAHQAPLSTGFSRHEYWSGLPFLFTGDLPNPGIKPLSPVFPALAGRFFTTEPSEKPHFSANKGLSSQSYGFSSSHVWMWELDYKESWAVSNWCFWPVVLEKTLEAPLDCKEIKPVNPKGNQSWILEGLMLKLKLRYFGHLMQRPDSLGKTLMLGKIEGTREGDCRGWDGWMASLT